MTASRDAGAPPGRRPLHLRTKLILATLALLTAICVAIGVFSHLAMSDYLTRQLDTALEPAAGRAGFPGGRPPGDDQRPSRDVDPENAAGQRPGTLNAVFDDGAVRNSALVQDDGSTEPLTDADLAALAGLDPAAGPEELTLGSGHYRWRPSSCRRTSTAPSWSPACPPPSVTAPLSAST